MKHNRLHKKLTKIATKAGEIISFSTIPCYPFCFHSFGSSAIFQRLQRSWRLCIGRLGKSHSFRSPLISQRYDLYEFSLTDGEPSRFCADSVLRLTQSSLIAEVVRCSDRSRPPTSRSKNKNFVIERPVLSLSRSADQFILLRLQLAVGRSQMPRPDGRGCRGVRCEQRPQGCRHAVITFLCRLPAYL